ncbi:protein kinase domain-containing protein [Anabaena sp. CCY 9402-a]|uniref:bifunctional serine/threonine-protein kinase/ABC transporter substrate-binding protein n=1 Tax=Anabaena sp. CCY 9402-a TaxID=3103867 RepID=UPI0039C66AD8
MEVYCTRPSCTKPENTIPDECLTARAATEICCANCKMPLILQARFVAIDLLGSGGFGRTFKAKDILRANDQIFSRNIRVIKQLHPINHPGQILTPSTLNYIEEKFGEEASTLEELRHQQIPRFWDYFHEEVNEETGRVQKFFYLVQDYIAGHNLDQELQQKGKFAEDEVINILKEILNILKYIHNYDGTHGVIHRDIKPANIMHCSYDGRLYLIDFGAVRQIVQGLPIDTTSIVLDARFAPPEQFRGEKLSFASDLFALATTCLCLLTGNKNPQRLLFKSKLKENLQVKDQHFAEALDKMLQYEPEDRPQSAQEVLDILSAELKPDLLANQAPAPNSLSTQTSNPDPHPKVSWFKRFSNGVERLPQRWRSIIGFSLSFFLGIAIAVAAHHKPPVPPPAAPPPNSQYFSRGEESLIPELNANSNNPSCQEAYKFKQDGMKVFQKANLSGNKSDFKDAEDLFTASIQKSKQISPVVALNQGSCVVDPETFIYKYNSKVAQSDLARQGSLPTIAVVNLNESTSDIDIPLEILRGVAQVLDEQNTANPSFQILLGSYNKSNVETIARAISNHEIPGDRQYFNKSQILGVVGRYTSSNIWQVGNIYGGTQGKEIVVIAPTSTATRNAQSSTQDRLNSYVFRTASNDAIASEDLANYIQSNSQWKKILIIYEDERYSNSLTQEFRNELRAVGVNRGDIYTCNLFEEECSDKATKEKVDVVMLAPEPKLESIEKAIDTATKARARAGKNIQLLGGDVLYDKKTFELGNAAVGMVIPVFSHIHNTNNDFKKRTQRLWGTEKVSWRTISSYDAAQVFVKALTDLSQSNTPTRRDVYIILKKNGKFFAPGATTDVRFDQNGDRKLITGVGVLVKVDKNNPQSDEYGFTLLKIPERNNS